jgi:hypothetical protein
MVAENFKLESGVSYPITPETLQALEEMFEGMTVIGVLDYTEPQETQDDN